MKFAAPESTLVATNCGPTAHTITSHVDPEGARRLQEMVINFYSNPELAVVREAAANAADSTRRSGTGIPVNITTPTHLEPNLVITDRGTGMSAAEVESNFLAFAASTKRNTNDEIGGLGVGAKSPWAISESFLIDTVKDGKRTIVRAAKNLVHQVIMSDEDTDLPNGTTISIPVKVEGQAEKWEQVIREVAIAHEPDTITVDGNPVTSIAGGPNRIGPVICAQVPGRYSYSGTVMIRSGGTLFESVKEITYLAKQSINLRSFVIDLPIGSFDHTPSRETIIDTERTRKAIEIAIAQYTVAYNTLETQLTELGKVDVTAAITRRIEILGDQDRYDVLPIHLSMSVPTDIGAWKAERRWASVDGITKEGRDSFAATSWADEANRTIIVTDVPAKKKLRTFATYVKNNHNRIHRILTIPAGKTHIELGVVDKRLQPTGQTFKIDTSMVDSENVYTYERWVEVTKPLRSNVRASGYDCTVWTIDGTSGTNREMNATEILATGLPVWFVEEDRDNVGRGRGYSLGTPPKVASVGVFLGRRKVDPLKKAIPAAITLRAWQTKCNETQTSAWSDLTKRALSVHSSHGSTEFLFKVAAAAHRQLVKDGRAHIPTFLVEMAEIQDAFKLLTDQEKQAYDSLNRNMGRGGVNKEADTKIEELQVALKEAWPLLNHAPSYSGVSVGTKPWVEYMLAVKPNKPAE